MERVTELEKKMVNGVLDREDTCLSGFYKNPNGGPSITAFESYLREYHGIPDGHAIAVSNGTTALHVALLACGIKPGDEVITTPLTFAATATAILMCGAKPVFIDVDPESYNMDPSHISSAISRRTKAILPVHLLGTPCDMDAIIEETKGDFPIIEDNAQGLGAQYNGRYTGTIGDISITSFQETKTITTAGEGGAILTNNQRLAEKCRYLRNHGSHYAKTPYLAYNYRMTEIQAAFGIAQMERLDAFLENQRKNAEYLIGILPDYFKVQTGPKYSIPNRYIIGTTVNEDIPRPEMIKKLTERGINKNLPGATVGLGYQNTIMDLPVLKKYERDCLMAQVLTMEFIWFDITRWVSYEEIQKIGDVILECIP